MAIVLYQGQGVKRWMVRTNMVLLSIPTSFTSLSRHHNSEFGQLNRGQKAGSMKILDIMRAETVCYTITGLIKAGEDTRD